MQPKISSNMQFLWCWMKCWTGLLHFKIWKKMFYFVENIFIHLGMPWWTKSISNYIYKLIIRARRVTKFLSGSNTFHIKSKVDPPLQLRFETLIVLIKKKCVWHYRYVITFNEMRRQNKFQNSNVAMGFLCILTY